MVIVNTESGDHNAFNSAVVVPGVHFFARDDTTYDYEKEI